MKRIGDSSKGWSFHSRKDQLICRGVEVVVGGSAGDPFRNIGPGDAGGGKGRGRSSCCLSLCLGKVRGVYSDRSEFCPPSLSSVH